MKILGRKPSKRPLDARVWAFARAHRRPLLWATLAWILVTAGLGLWGWWEVDPQAPWDDIYRTLQLFWLAANFPPPGDLPPQLEVARFLAAAALVLTVAAALLRLFGPEYRRWLVSRSAGHVIVCGLGDKGFEVTRALRDEGLSVVVLQLDAESDHLPAIRDLGALDLVADATEEDTLRAARLAKATHLLVLCNEDHRNTEIAETARRVLDESGGDESGGDVRRMPVVCKVLISDDAWWRQLDPLRITADNRTIDVEYFSLHRLAAERLLSQCPPAAGVATDGSELTRVAVIGQGAFARAVASHLAEIWTVGEKQGSRLELHLWGVAAATMREDLLDGIGGGATASTRVAVVPHKDAHPLDERVTSHAALCRVLGQVLDDLDPAGHVYVCLDSDHRGVAAALVLAELMGPDAVATTATVCLSQAGGMATLLAQAPAAPEGDSGPLEVFDIFETLRDPGLREGFYEALARSIHDAYRIKHPSRSASRPWDALSDPDRDQNRRQALRYGDYLRELGCGVTRRRALIDQTPEFTREEIDPVCRLEHTRWLKDKRADGWELGERKEGRKTNPFLMEWDELEGDEAKRTTREEILAIPRNLAAAGYHVYRLHAASPAGTEGESPEES